MVHPGFDVGDAVGEGGEDGRNNGCGVDVQLGIVSITVKLKNMAADDVT